MLYSPIISTFFAISKQVVIFFSFYISNWHLFWLQWQKANVISGNDSI